jgi:uncharacterized protein YutE (UPF0331/DUF86 family)
MYQVNTTKIEAILRYLEKQMKVLDGWKETEDTFGIRQLALERLLHVSIESVTDVGNLLIDGFIMRDPGSYEDIIDILRDEQVIDREMADQFKALVGCRHAVLKAYTSLTYDWVEENMFRFKAVISSFPEAVRAYLKKEL